MSDFEDPWIARWLDAVSATSMSQRVVSSIEKHGGLAALIAAARARDLHLLQVTDDEGNALIAASARPFEVLC